MYEFPSADRFKGFHPYILEVGARVFVTNNDWFQAGVANGAAEEVVVHVQWGSDEGGVSRRSPQLPELSLRPHGQLSRTSSPLRRADSGSGI